MSDKDDKKPIEARFNAGIAKLERIDGLKTGFYRANISSLYPEARVCLEAWFNELWAFMNPAEQDKGVRWIDEISRSINSIINYRRDPERIRTSLMRMARWLETIEIKYGLSMPPMENAYGAADM